MSIIYDSDSLFEMCELDRADFDTSLDALSDTGFLTKEINTEDVAYFKARKDLTWSEVVKIDSPSKKQILLHLIENPKTFFVLYNTQKGKLRIASEEMRSWATIENKKVVAFLLVDNDKTLADQSADGLFKIVEGVAEKFLLSSNTSVSVNQIKDRIDSYAAFGGLMPIIVALNNPKQIAKVVELMEHIQVRSKTCPDLCYGAVFDEADKIYPPVREKFSKVLVEDNSTLHRLGFVTATEGPLLEEEFPECANAYMYPVPAGNPNYRAIHTEDVVLKKIQHLKKDNNDAYAEAIIELNKDYFKETVDLKNGQTGFRKVIVNGGAKRASMEGFANRRVADGANAITVNMNGICVYRQGHEKKRYSTKGVRFGEKLFAIYNELALQDKPLFVIGRRKVDRGLGFHYAPWDGSDGLVFTDMILGRVDDKSTAVQKAGRLAGVVAQCPQYPGKLTWWTDEKTAAMVSHHNDVVDTANTKLGCSALQAVVRAEAEVPFVDTEAVDIKTYRVYSDEVVAREVCTILGYFFRKVSPNAQGFRETSLNKTKEVASLKDAVKKVPTAYGTNNGVKTWRTYYPCYVDTNNNATQRFVVIIRPDTDEAKVAQADARHASIPYRA